MATLVTFHAHPDDECITTGGVIAKYSAAGHRVIIVSATGGEHGEVPEDLEPGETIVERRRRELECSAAALGAARVAWLGYSDSGMTGWEQNTGAGAFAAVDVEEAAERLAAILVEEQADTLTVYDWHGNYGHPDHVKVHHVGHRAAEIAGTPHVYEATTNRDQIEALVELAATMGMDTDELDPDGVSDDGNPMGTPEAELTTAVDVAEFVGHKRRAIECHRSQVTDTTMFLSIPDDVFAAMMGTEWFIKKGAEPGIAEHGLAGMQ